MGHVLTAACSLIVVAAILGCGSSDDAATDSAQMFSGEKQKVAQVVEDLESASKEGDIKRICEEILAPKVVAEAERAGQDCEEGGKDLKGEVGRYGGKDSYDLDVTRVNLSGSEATAEVRYSGGGRDRKETLTLLKEDGRWGIGVKGGTS